MSSTQSLFRKVVQATDAGTMKWKIVPRTAYSEVIFQPSYVFRIFESKFQKDEDDYVVLLVEKKYDDPEWDFDVERYRPELHFLYEGSIVLTIDEDEVDLIKLVRFAKTVESSTDRAKKLLG